MVSKANPAKAVEKELEQEEQNTIHTLAESDLRAASSSKGDSKSILIMIGVIVGIFVLTLGGFKLYNSIIGASVVVIDDLHQKNLEGELDQDEGYIYNGYSFVKADGLWWTEIEVEQRLIKIPLHFSPEEVKEIPVSGKLSPEFNQGEKIYVAIDPEVNYNKYYTLAIMEMNNNILQGVNRNIEAACTTENPICENRTIINCETAEGKPVVEFAVDEVSGVQLQGSCVKISGDEYDLVKAVDRMLYVWYKIMTE